MNKERLKHQTETEGGGKHLHVQRQSDRFPQTTASADWTGDKRLGGGSKLQQSQVIASWWCCSHMELAVWQRGYFRHMVRWWFAFKPQLVWIGRRDCHQVLPHPPWAQTHHWRALQGWHIPLQTRWCLEQCWTPPPPHPPAAGFRSYQCISKWRGIKDGQEE